MAAVIFDGAGTALGDRHIVQTDERGSVLSIADANGGTMESINSYGPYGEPSDSNVGAFGYTGQLWLPEAGLWYMRNRVYDPTLGRFMQTDPIGYQGGMNLYGYVGGDPVNGVDPLGLSSTTCDVLSCPQAIRDDVQRILDDLDALADPFRQFFSEPLIVVTACQGPTDEDDPACQRGLTTSRIVFNTVTGAPCHALGAMLGEGGLRLGADLTVGGLIAGRLSGGFTLTGDGSIVRDTSAAAGIPGGGIMGSLGLNFVPEVPTSGSFDSTIVEIGSGPIGLGFQRDANGTRLSSGGGGISHILSQVRLRRLGLNVGGSGGQFTGEVVAERITQPICPGNL